MPSIVQFKKNMAGSNTLCIRPVKEFQIKTSNPLTHFRSGQPDKSYSYEGISTILKCLGKKTLQASSREFQNIIWPLNRSRVKGKEGLGLEKEVGGGAETVGTYEVTRTNSRITPDCLESPECLFT